MLLTFLYINLTLRNAVLYEDVIYLLVQSVPPKHEAKIEKAGRNTLP